MKKLYTTPRYKARQKRIGTSLIFKFRKRKNRPKYLPGRHFHTYTSTISDDGEAVVAPVDLRLIENPVECLLFFRSIRDVSNHVNGMDEHSFVNISLKDVRHLDYATISVLTAISDDLKVKRVNMRGDFPVDEDCKRFMVDSGFLDQMFNEFGNRYAKSAKSQLIFFEKGSGKLSAAENMKMADLVKSVVKHLTGAPKHFNPVKSILLEICGNSIEHADTQNKQWLLGILYEDEKVTFTVTDVGKGIIATLHKKFAQKVFDQFSSESAVLLKAFERKYGSKTRELNRNKGLPAIKDSFDQGKILDLKVLTNNVILHFNDHTRSKAFKSGSPRFKGTLYQWEISNECLNNTVK
jgi:hypothetical protein